MKASLSEQEAATALRELFTARACQVPVVDDLSAVALMRARRISRRRASVGGLVATLAIVLTFGVAVSSQSWWLTDDRQGSGGMAAGAGGHVEFDAETTQAPVATGKAPLKVDIVMGGQLYDSTGGKWRSLGSGDAAVTVVRTPLGWLTGDPVGLRLLRTDGKAVPLMGAVEGWVASPDGTEIAAVAGTTLFLERLTRDGVADIATSPVPAGHVPIGFLSTSVLLATADRSRFGVWRRDGSFHSATGLSEIYGSFQADTFAVVPGSPGRPCLVRVTVGSGELRKNGAAGCHEGLEQGMQRAAISPNGQNLATPFDGGLWIINLARSVASASANAATNPVWVAACASDRDATPVWQDDNTVLTSARGALVACGVDGSQRTVELPRGVPGTGRLVPIRR